MGVIRFRVATEFNVVEVEVHEEVQKRVDKLRSEGRCLGCERKILKGEKVRLCQCPTCSSGTYNALARGYVTREQLLQAGKIAQTQKGRKPANDYTKSLQDASKAS